MGICKTCKGSGGEYVRRWSSAAEDYQEWDERVGDYDVCEGTGRDDTPVTCGRCHGTGRVWSNTNLGRGEGGLNKTAENELNISLSEMFNPTGREKVKCTNCKGTGKIERKSGDCFITKATLNSLQKMMTATS